MKEKTALPGERLGEFIRRVREENNWSMRDVSDRARAQKHELSDSYLAQIETDPKKNPTPKKLRAIAAGLNLDPIVFNTILFGGLEDSSLSETEIILINKFRRADARAQQDISLIVDAISNSRPLQELAFKPTEDDYTEVETGKTAKPTKNVGKKRTKSPHFTK